MGKPVRPEVERWRFQCCRSHHDIEIIRKGNVALLRDEKRSHHGNATIRTQRIGPRANKAWESLDILTWWHAKTCPNKAWCEFSRHERFGPRRINGTVEWEPDNLAFAVGSYL